VAGNRYEFGYGTKVTGTDVQCCYPRIVYPLGVKPGVVEMSSAHSSLRSADFSFEHCCSVELLVASEKDTGVQQLAWSIAE
jgi:hypothetical protein